MEDSGTVTTRERPLIDTRLATLTEDAQRRS